jgi:hypothetical protein
MIYNFGVLVSRLYHSCGRKLTIAKCSASNGFVAAGAARVFMRFTGWTTERNWLTRCRSQSVRMRSRLQLRKETDIGLCAAGDVQRSHALFGKS